MAMTAACSISVLSGNLVILRLALLLPVTTESLALQGGDDRKAYNMYSLVCSESAVEANL